jgi:hypothetical protein
MVLGAVWCPLDKRREIAVRLREIKREHALSESFEVKWIKVSPAKQEFYNSLINYFFDDDDLHFRALIIPDKTMLRHQDFPGQDHDTWYYKMYFDMLKIILRPDSRYRIYRQVIERVQLVQSHEIEQLQLADLLIGAVSYLNRDLHGNAGKTALIHRMQQRSGYSLIKTTLLREDKVNIFRWHATEVQG